MKVVITTIVLGLTQACDIRSAMMGCSCIWEPAYGKGCQARVSKIGYWFGGLYVSLAAAWANVV